MTVVLTHPSKMAVFPKYWNRPMSALTSAASSHAAAATRTRLSVRNVAAALLQPIRKTAAQAQENSRVGTAGVGPMENGFNQGSAMSRTAAMKGMGIAVLCAVGTGICWQAVRNKAKT
jgi:hypothetical protein